MLRILQTLFFAERGFALLLDVMFAMYPGVQKMLDKLAKTNIIHKNKAANLKSKLAAYISKLA